MLECFWHQSQDGLDQIGNGPSSPSLWMAGNRITNRYAIRLTLKPREDLGQSVVCKILRRFHDRAENATGFLIESVVPEPGGNKRIVVRPDGAEVIPDRVVAWFFSGECTDAPTAKHVLGQQSFDRRAGILRVDNACPQRLSGIGRNCCRSTILRLQRQGVELPLLNPEVSIEPRAQRLCLISQLPGALRFSRALVEISQRNLR